MRLSNVRRSSIRKSSIRKSSVNKDNIQKAKQRSGHRFSMSTLFLIVLVAADPVSAQGPRLGSFEADGTSVKVQVLGLSAPGTATSAGELTLILESTTCGEVGRMPVIAHGINTGMANTATVTFEGALDDVTGHCGLQYEARLESSGCGPGCEGAGGAGIGTDLDEARFFRVSLRCQGTSCDFVLTPDLKATNALFLSSALHSAISEAAFSGDLIAAVSAAEPALRDAVLSHVLDLEGLLDNDGSGLSAECTCQWAGILSRPDDPTIMQPHAVELRACPAIPVAEETLSTQLELTLICHTLGTDPVLELALPGQTWTASPIESCDGPLAAPLPAPFELEFEGDVAAGGVDLGYEAMADLAVTFTFDGVPLMATDLTAYRDASDDDELKEDSGFLGSGPVTALSATLTTSGIASVIAPWGSAPDIGAAVNGELTLRVGTLEWSLEAKRGVNNTQGGGEDPVPCEDFPPEY